MRIYLDDVRNCGFSTLECQWRVVRTFKEVISLLETGEVTELDLDHDLGTRKTGYDVLLWIERKVVKEGFVPPKMFVHTANPAAEKKMSKAIVAIQEMVRNRERSKLEKQYIEETLPLIQKDKRGRFLKEI
jgi:hypothetical protein